MMTYNIELTEKELVTLSAELELLVDEYEKRASKASEIKCGTEPYWLRFADEIKPILEKANTALHTA